MSNTSANMEATLRASVEKKRWYKASDIGDAFEAMAGKGMS
jgi:hypothetical protein